jgi:hypothetical protein
MLETRDRTLQIDTTLELKILSHGSDEQVMKEILVSTVGPKAKLLS